MRFRYPRAAKDMEKWGPVMDDFWKKISEGAVSDETIRPKVADLKKQVQESIKKLGTEVRTEVAI